ncbi:reticulon-4-interacting protein 1, mitochondrial [Chelonus insularis]|uniref:reticulon-4-interacting protein 1, mitochondrial n=1 Tax=Chelonus insularis TaxID=460826 RepID=UPI00158855A3|nr:reticulon-4-interacting protein 1, mitochondrial [Chelonus insularis]
MRLSQFRQLLHATCSKKSNVEGRMLAWQIHDYGNLSQLKQSSVRIPVLKKPTEVLIKVKAASVNPIDIAMIRGYGAKVINILRIAKQMKTDLEFPLTLGRDFSGVIVEKGHQVPDRLELGDDVWGVVPVEQQGCHAQYVVVDNCFVNKKPLNLSHAEAASILYAGLTAWSSLWITGGLSYKSILPSISNKKILILGGSGGVGTLAIQIAKSWKLFVVTTCSADATELLKTLGANIVIDYKQNDADLKLENEGPYHIVLDCSNQKLDDIPHKKYSYDNYITLNSPLLRHVDDYGIVAGFAKNISSFLKSNVMQLKKSNKGCIKWGFFVPSSTGINMLQTLVENKQLIPVVEKIYSLEELPQAYQRVVDGHLRGKLVIEMNN